jgi:hypothetical protein
LLKYSTLILILSACAHFMSYERIDYKTKNLSSLVLTGYGLTSYKLARVEAYLEELTRLNANTASFLYTCYTQDKNSSIVDCGSYDSPGLEELSDAIGLAKRAGFIVNLRVYIDISAGGWRCHWNPMNKKEAFKNINQTLSHMASFAEKRKIELFIIGAELCELTKKKYTQNWINIIKDIRKLYKGKITYGANWGNVNGIIEWKEIAFWSHLDYFGIDHYRPIPNMIKTNDISDYQDIHFKEYITHAKKYQKEIIITELGFPGHENGNLRPFDWTLKGKDDQIKQARYYKKTLSAINRNPEIKGLFVWRKLFSRCIKDAESAKPSY